VFHLIPDWHDAIGELMRVIRPGGVLLLDAGHRDTGPWREVDDRLEAEIGDRTRHVGLNPEDVADLDAEVARRGGVSRDVPPLWQESDLTVERSLDDIASGVYSWTWNVDPGVLERGIANVRAWALERFGRLDEVLEPRYAIQWRAYDVTG
jgi:SAM-dependent methyltransferase